MPVESLMKIAPLDGEIQAVVERVRPSVVTIRDGQHGAGAGIVWTPDGLIVTNDHVVRRDKPEVIFAQGEQAIATVVTRDRTNDLAALRVDRAALPAASAADSRQLRVGQLVLAIGHPGGVPHAVTAGVVSGLAVPGDLRELIRADIVLNPGNSGGPLLDADGRVVGVNAMVTGPRASLAVPSHVVRAFLAQVQGPIPYLGIEARLAQVPAAYLTSFGYQASTVLVVTGVEAGSPAEAAGIIPGDLIVAAGTRTIWAPGALRDEILLSGSSGYLPLTVIRADTRLEIICQLGERPAARAA